MHFNFFFYPDEVFFSFLILLFFFKLENAGICFKVIFFLGTILRCKYKLFPLQPLYIKVNSTAFENVSFILYWYSESSLFHQYYIKFLWEDNVYDCSPALLKSMAFYAVMFSPMNYAWKSISLHFIFFTAASPLLDMLRFPSTELYSPCSLAPSWCLHSILDKMGVFNLSPQAWYKLFTRALHRFMR